MLTRFFCGCCCYPFYSGGPNSNDFAANHTVHHTIGEKDLGQQYRAFKEVTCAAVVVQHLTEAHHQIDKAISEALVSKPSYMGDWPGVNCRSTMETPVILCSAVAASTCILQKQQKPAYIEIGCNLAGLPNALFH